MQLKKIDLSLTNTLKVKRKYGVNIRLYYIKCVLVVWLFTKTSFV